MLIKCPECEKEVSDKADKCPNCGYPMTPAEEDVDSAKIGILVLILGVVGIILAFVIGSGIMLAIPGAMFVIAIIMSKKCYRWFSNIGLFFSVIGIALIVIEFLKGMLF